MCSFAFTVTRPAAGPRRPARRLHPALRLAAVSAALVLGGLPAALASSAHGASGRWFVRAADAGSSSVWFGTFGWASTAAINWTLPTFTADGAALPTAPVPFIEPKYTLVGGFPTARVFTGYNVTGTGPAGSLAVSTGTGSSNVGIAFYGANWSVTASGAGTYDVRAVAKDPWDIRPEDLAGLDSATYSLYIPFSMLGGGYVAGKSASSFSYEVSYATAQATESLLSVTVDASGVSLGHSSTLGSQLSYYLQADGSTVPTGTSAPGTLLSDSALRSLIESRVAGGSLSSPIDLGIVLTGLPVPTTLMAGGAVAQIGVDVVAQEAAAVPEPGSLALMLAGLGTMGGMGALVQRRRAVAQAAPQG